MAWGALIRWHAATRAVGTHNSRSALPSGGEPVGTAIALTARHLQQCDNADRLTCHIHLYLLLIKND